MRAPSVKGSRDHGRGSSAWAYLPAAVTFAVGAILSAVLYVLLSEQDYREAQAVFEMDAKARINLFEAGLAANVHAVEALGAFLAASDRVTRESYDAFVKPFLAKGTGVQALQWSPRVTEADRAAYEDGVRNEGVAEFRIQEQSENGDIVPAQKRSEHFPVRFVAPYAGNEQALGLDLAANAKLSRALRWARDRARMFTVSKAGLLQEGEREDGVVVLLPVFSRKEALSSPEEGQARLAGYVTAVFRVGDILEESLRSLVPQGVDIEVLDAFGEPGKKLLYYRAAPTRTMPGQPVAEDLVLRLKAIRFVRELQIGSRRWLVVCTPTPEYLAGAFSWQPLVGLGTGLAFTLVLVWYFLANIARTRRIEALVRSRTAELVSANERLTFEIAERKRFEEERDELLELLEASNTSLRDLNARLERSNQDLQDFAFVASHDLKEPLRKIHVFAQRLEGKYAGDLGERGAEYVTLIRDATERMSRLITDLLAVSRVATHGQPFVETDLNAIVAEVLSDLAVPIDESAARVDVGDLPTIDADPTQMRQLFQNLLGNSLKYRASDGPPVMTVAGDILAPPASSEGGGTPGLCQITVKDNGIGFGAEDAERVFSIFQRLHPEDGYEGSGIGLAVCRKIAERHGGTISARSTPGQGATFFVTLPMVQSGDAGEQEAPPAEALARGE